MAVERFRTDIVEIDVHLSSDGVPVVAHDPTLERCTDGAGAIAETPWAKLQTFDAGYRFSIDGGRSHPFRGQSVRIPSLQQVLGELAGTRFNIELKCEEPGAELVFADCIRTAGAVSRVCVGSEHDDVAARIVAALPEACFFYPREALTRLVMTLRSGGAWTGDEPFVVLDMPLEFGGVRLVDRTLIEQTRRLGRWVNVWTIDEPKQMRSLVEQGVGGIMSDRPDLLREVLDAAPRPVPVS